MKCKLLVYTVFFFLLFINGLSAQEKPIEQLHEQYNEFINATGQKRIQTGRNIVQSLIKEGYDIDSTLYDNPLSVNDFDVKMFDLTTRFSFHKELYHLTIESANRLIQHATREVDSAALINGYYFIGFANQRLGEMNEGLIFAQKCYELCLETNNEEMMSSVLNNMGNIYMVNGQDSMAIVYFQKTLDIERKLDRKQNQAVRLGNMATVYMKLKMPDKALASAIEGLNLDLQYGRKDKLAIRYHQAAEVYLSMGNYEKAKEYDLNALEYFKKQNSAYGQSVIMFSLGEVEEKLQDTQAALHYYNQALLYADSLSNNLLIQKVCAKLYRFHKEKNSTLSLSYLERSIALKDSMFHADNQKQLSEFQVKYNTQQKELEIVHKQAEINRFKANRIIFIVSLSLSVVVLILLWWMLNLRNKRNNVLTEMNATKDKFFSIISHDLKNPAIAQRNAIQQLVTYSKEWNPSLLSKYYDGLLKSAEGQVELLNSLLKWAQVQTGRMSFNPVHFNLIETLRSDITLIENIAKRKGLIVDFRMPEIAIVNGDSDMITTVLRNLLTNAVKFTHVNGTVSLDIKLLENNNGCIISVSDTGIGMSEKQLRTLFNLDNQHSLQGTNGETGSGFGLLVCKELIEKHGSMLHVESEEGKGSRFWFTIDCTKGK